MKKRELSGGRSRTRGYCPDVLHDVVVAVVGTSAAIAGFTLVFLGILVTSYQSLLGALPSEAGGGWLLIVRRG